MSSGTAVPPPVSWAQRNDLLFININVECSDVTYKFTENSMYFKGTSVVGGNLHEVTLNFANKINPDKVTVKNIIRCLEFTIYKAQSGPFWSSLLADKEKPHYLKVDFHKWVDESSDTEEPAEKKDTLKDIMDMYDTGSNKPNFDDFDYDQEDSDDENIPSLTPAEDADENSEEDAKKKDE